MNDPTGRYVRGVGTAKTLSPLEFVALLRADSDASRVVDEHLEDHDELLIHLLMADLLRLAVARFSDGDAASSARLIQIVDRGLVEGDPALANAVAVSFVEHVGSAPGESPAFIASWPSALRDERGRQRGYRADL